MQLTKIQIQTFVHDISHPELRNKEFEKKLLNAFLECYQDPQINVYYLAANLNINERTLRTRCREVVNMSPSELLVQIRIRHAKLLLKKGVESSKIWQQVGFNSHSYFSATFKKLINESPNAYRCKYLEPALQ
jgi:AraC-like DNA-binding protein